MTRRRAGRLTIVAGALFVAAACTSVDGESAETAVEQPTARGLGIADQEFETLDGGTLTFADLRGHPVVVHFWASWAPMEPQFAAALEGVHRDTPEVQVLGINTQDRPETALAEVERTGMTYESLWDPDGALFKAFEVVGMPATIFLDSEGRLVSRHIGMLTAEQLRQEIDRHLS